MASLTSSTDHDFGTGLVSLRFRGDLDDTSAPVLRAAVLRALAECPVGAIVDLDQVRVRSAQALRPLLALAREHDGTPIVVRAGRANPDAELIRTALPGIAVCDDSVAAAAACGEGHSRVRRARAHLAPDADAPVAARKLVARLCGAAGLEHLWPKAAVIISELVTNVVRHAGTDMEVSVTVGPTHLHLQVRDRAHALPTLAGVDSFRPDHSRGLKLVDSIADGWGTTVTPYGKTVWATLLLTSSALTPIC